MALICSFLHTAQSISPLPCPVCNVYLLSLINTCSQCIHPREPGWLEGTLNGKAGLLTWELVGTSASGALAELLSFPVSMTTADSSVVDHCSLPLRNTGGD